MKIGIIGAENTHTVAIAKALNVEHRMPGCSVELLWGETEQLARKAAEAGAIPKIVRNPEEMLGQVDAVVVDHRHPKYHLPAALPFVKQGIPVFVDKPFCDRVREGRRFLDVARKHGAPVTSFSTMPLQASFRAWVRQLSRVGDVLTGATFGPCDVDSPYGGVFFYGIHHVEMALQAFGYDVREGHLVRGHAVSVARLIYDGGKTVTLHLMARGASGFAVAAAGSKGFAARPVRMDSSPYWTGIRTFIRMFQTRRAPLTDDQLLTPVAVLEALQRSLRSGRMEPISA